MCGIIGSINLNSSPLERGLELLIQRGPDSTGVFYNSNRTTSLGHTRLAIINLDETANQPFYSSDNRYVLVYNGELYNYRELANKHSLSLRTNSDTEVIIELYAKLGKNFLSELNGMFAGAIYDTHKDELFLFRDRLGIKPLYYYKKDSQFVFASELPALLEIVEQPDLNQQSISDFFYTSDIFRNQIQFITMSINFLPVLTVT